MKRLSLWMIAISLLSSVSAFADCRQNYRKCARDCSWMHAACDMPSSPFCISENRKCMDSCDKEHKCTANTLGGGASAPSPDSSPAAKEAEQSAAPVEQQDTKQENSLQE